MAFPAETKVRINPKYTQEMSILDTVFKVVEYLPSDSVMGSLYKIVDEEGMEWCLFEHLLVEVEPAPEAPHVDYAVVNYIAEIIQEHSVVAFVHDYSSVHRISKPTLRCECGEEFVGGDFSSHALHIATELYSAGLR